MVGVVSNDIWNGFDFIDTNRWYIKNVTIIAGIEDERKLGQSFFMIYDMKNNLKHDVEWEDIDFAPYAVVELCEISFIPRVTFLGNPWYIW